MNRSSAITAALLLVALIALGCSSGTGTANNPLLPENSQDLTSDAQTEETTQPQTVLWGFYDLYIDIDNQTIEAVVNRDVMFTCNIVAILNNNPATLGFSFNSFFNAGTHVEVDLDLSITHPFTGMNQFDGYDVRGVLICEGSGTLDWNHNLLYPVMGVDQYLVNADGYTRWYNAPEFLVPGLFGYTPGIYSSAVNPYMGATLNPYKYFTDALGPTDDACAFLQASGASNGVFLAGTTSTRNYVIEFPLPTPGPKYAYAILANWESTTIHPSNAPEAVANAVVVTDDIWYIDPLNNGGDLILDITLCHWDIPPSEIWIESTVLSMVYELLPAEMIPTASGPNWNTWHCEIPADNVTGTDDQEFWVIGLHDSYDYSNPFMIPNNASGPMASLFRHDLYVSGDSPNEDPVCDLIVVTPMPASGPAPVQVEFDASASYDPDPGDLLTFEWDFDGDLLFGDPFTGTQENPIFDYMFDFIGDVCVKVTDPYGGEAVCCMPVEVDVDSGNAPPNILSGVDGNIEPAPDGVDDYTVVAEDPEMDPLMYLWDVTEVASGLPVFGGPGDGAGSFTIDWTVDIGASDGEIYVIDCSVADPFNPPVEATPLTVTIVETGGIVILYEYDGEVDDGGIVNFDNGSGIAMLTWEYCAPKLAWDEDECGPYGTGEYRLARTPILTFPDPGTFTTIHLEVWHWGDMQDDGSCYGTLGTADTSDVYAPNWATEDLVYIEGFDHNDGSWADFSFVYGSEAVPEWSHFNCDAYAGSDYGIAFGFGEYGAANPLDQDGWNIRKVVVWYEPI